MDLKDAKPALTNRIQCSPRLPMAVQVPATDCQGTRHTKEPHCPCAHHAHNKALEAWVHTATMLPAQHRSEHKLEGNQPSHIKAHTQGGGIFQHTNRPRRAERKVSICWHSNRCDSLARRKQTAGDGWQGTNAPSCSVRPARMNAVCMCVRTKAAALGSSQPGRRASHTRFSLSCTVGHVTRPIDTHEVLPSSCSLAHYGRWREETLSSDTCM